MYIWTVKGGLNRWCFCRSARPGDLRASYYRPYIAARRRREGMLQDHIVYAGHGGTVNLAN